MTSKIATEPFKHGNNPHWLHAVVRRLVACLHVHRWEETLWNAWGIDVEQRCRCGQYRHHLFEHRRGFCQEPNWQLGKHPNRYMAK